jgi:hypothetical protein
MPKTAFKKGEADSGRPANSSAAEKGQISTSASTWRRSSGRAAATFLSAASPNALCPRCGSRNALKIDMNMCGCASGHAAVGESKEPDS